MNEYIEQLASMIDNLENDRMRLLRMLGQKPFSDVRIQPIIPLMLNAYSYLSTNLQLLRQYVIDRSGD